MTKRMTMYASMLMGFGAALFAGAAFAGQSVSSIAAAAALHAEARAVEQRYNGVAVDLRPLDARIQLAACASPLQVTTASERALGPVSLSVSCNHPNAWRVQVRGSVSAVAELPVLALPVNRGDVLAQVISRCDSNVLRVISLGISATSRILWVKRRVRIWSWEASYENLTLISPKLSIADKPWRWSLKVPAWW